MQRDQSWLSALGMRLLTLHLLATIPACQELAEVRLWYVAATPPKHRCTQVHVQAPCTTGRAWHALRCRQTQPLGARMQS